MASVRVCGGVSLALGRDWNTAWMHEMGPCKRSTVAVTWLVIAVCTYLNQILEKFGHFWNRNHITHFLPRVSTRFTIVAYSISDKCPTPTRAVITIRSWRWLGDTKVEMPTRTSTCDIFYSNLQRFAKLVKCTKNWMIKFMKIKLESQLFN